MLVVADVQGHGHEVSVGQVQGCDVEEGVCSLCAHCEVCAVCEPLCSDACEYGTACRD